MNSGLTGAVSPYFSFSTTILQPPVDSIHLTSGAVWSENPREYNFHDSPRGSSVCLAPNGYIQAD